MHTILYPPGHKKAGQRKAEKDVTREERQSQEAQQRGFDCQRKFVMQEMLLDFQKMMQTMSSQLVSRK